ncbi:MAG TPA: MFS transporter, partial [Novosphingobium sp.]|nr:MFS transporter [Novosphingobium sp.]
GWTLDAFDFFLMVFMLKAIAADFGVGVKDVSEALFLTLAARPLGALVFGRLADRIGRRPVLMGVILAFSVLSALSGAAANLTQLLLVRALFGFAMGGEWGLGASLVMESVPAGMRGRVSGLLQAGYPSGYLLASLAYFLFFDAIGWRWMFVLGMAPALLVAFIRMGVAESPVFLARRHEPVAPLLIMLAAHWKRALYLVVLMTAFTTFSHGTQDLYPTFLQDQHGLSTKVTGTITLMMNVGAICGALAFGALSHRLGRQRTIIAAAIIAVPIIPLWAYGNGLAQLAAGAVLMQFAVQGAWSMVPAYLNELSPYPIRATFPGVVYQLGNLLSARNVVFQADLAAGRGGDYAYALALVAGITAAVLVIWTAFGPRPQDDMAALAPPAATA